MYGIKIYKKEIIDSFIELGADIPACFYSYNQKVQGLGEKLIKLRPLNKLVWAVVIKPEISFSTKEIFKKFSKPFSKKTNYYYNYKNLILDINSHENDLQEAAKNYSFSFYKLINSLPQKCSLAPPRMTGSGSTIFILFDKKDCAQKYMRSIKNITTVSWKKLSKVLL